jgi:hypothetical protein
LNNINNILQQNNYNINITAKLSTEKKVLNSTKYQEKTIKWATFTYIGKETRKINKDFPKYNNKNSL